MSGNLPGRKPASSESDSRPKSPAEIAGKLNHLLEKAMPILTPLGVALGVIFPKVFLSLRPFIPWLFSAITLSGSIKLRARDMGKAVSSPFPLLAFFITARFLIPVAVLFISRLIFAQDTDTISGYVLLYSVPTAVTGFIWITIYRGDPALSLTIILLDAIIAPLMVPGTVKLLLGTTVNIDATGMALSLIFMVLIPTVIGVALNEMSRGKIPNLIGPYLSPFSKVCMVLVISANSAAVAPQFSIHNTRMFSIIPVCILFSVFGFFCGKLAGIAGKLNKEKQVSLFFASGLRNTSAAMTLGIEFFPPAAAMPSVLGIMFQQTVAAFMGHFMFGKAKGSGD